MAYSMVKTTELVVMKVKPKTTKVVAVIKPRGKENYPRTPYDDMFN